MITPLLIVSHDFDWPSSQRDPLYYEVRANYACSQRVGLKDFFTKRLTSHYKHLSLMTFWSPILKTLSCPAGVREREGDKGKLSSISCHLRLRLHLIFGGDQ